MAARVTAPMREIEGLDSIDLPFSIQPNAQQSSQLTPRRRFRKGRGAR